jgi:hypothetical protein
LRRLFSYEKERFVALFMAKTNAIFRPHGDENGLLFRPQRGCVSAPSGRRKQRKQATKTTKKQKIFYLYIIYKKKEERK